jgi:hypothetical protein
MSSAGHVVTWTSVWPRFERLLADSARIWWRSSAPSTTDSVAEG